MHAIVLGRKMEGEVGKNFRRGRAVGVEEAIDENQFACRARHEIASEPD
jgi:hypothetical protein